MTRFNLPRPLMLVWLTLTLMMIYWVAVPPFIPDWIAIIIQCSRMTLSLLVMLTYGRAVYDVIHEREPTEAHGLILGIFLAFTADFYGSALGIAWRWAGKPEYWIYSFVWTYSSYVTSIAAIFHLAVPGAINGKIPRKNVARLVIALAIAGGIAALVLTFRITGQI